MKERRRYRSALVVFNIIVIPLGLVASVQPGVLTGAHFGQPGGATSEQSTVTWTLVFLAVLAVWTVGNAFLLIGRPDVTKPVGRILAGLLALVFTGYALALLRARIAEGPYALFWAAAAGVAAIVCWRFALRVAALTRNRANLE